MNELTLFNDFFNCMDEDYSFPTLTLKKAFQGPKVDIKESENEYILMLDIPGKNENDVNIELNNNVLTISSSKEEKNEQKEEFQKEKWIIHERTISSFCRNFKLPEDIDSEKISAIVQNGVLKIAIPRKILTSPKKIAITAA